MKKRICFRILQFMFSSLCWYMQGWNSSNYNKSEVTEAITHLCSQPVHPAHALERLSCQVCSPFRSGRAHLYMLAPEFHNLTFCYVLKSKSTVKNQNLPQTFCLWKVSLSLGDILGLLRGVCVSEAKGFSWFCMFSVLLQTPPVISVWLHINMEWGGCI